MAKKMSKKMVKNINEVGIKFLMRNQEEQPYGGSTWDNAKGELITYYVIVGVSIDDSEGINTRQFKGYERYNSYTQSYVKILSMFPKDGGRKYNYIVKGMIGVTNERSEEDLKFAASNSMIKLLNDLGIYTDYRESEIPCKIIKAGKNDGGVSKEIRPRGKEFTESKNMNRKNTIKLTESELKKVISESVKKILKEYRFSFNPNGYYEIEIKSTEWADNNYNIIPIPDDDDIWYELWEILPSVWIKAYYKDECIETFEIENVDEIENSLKNYLNPQEISNIIDKIDSWLVSDHEYLYDKIEPLIADAYEYAEAAYYDFLSDVGNE